MSLLSAVTREQLDPELQRLWDECQRVYPDFQELWAVMANSPTVFRHIWGALLELKRESSVAARHFELAILVVSALNRCQYCVSNHSARARQAGLTTEQVEYLSSLALDVLPEDYGVSIHPGFSPDDSVVLDWAYFLVWAGIYPHVAKGSPPGIHRLRQRLFARLAERFSARQIEELTWRIAQCVAFNWHNECLEIHPVGE